MGEKNNKKTAAIFRQQLGDDIYFEKSHPNGFETYM